MKPSSIVSAFEKNTRRQELTSREADRALSVATDDRARLKNAIIDTLQKLSAIQVEHYPTQAVIECLEKRTGQQEELQEKLRLVEVTIEKGLRNLASLNAQRQEVDQQLFEQMKTDPKYSALLANAKSLDGQSKQWAVSAQEIREEVDSKVQAYGENRLYTYLVGVNYMDEGQYKKRGLVRALDAWIANLCKFPSNRRNHLTLLGMKKENEQIQEERANALTQAKADVESLERSMENQSGSTDLLEKIRSVKAELTEHKRKANLIQEKLKAFSEKKDDQYAVARELMTQFLSGEDMASLMERTIKTDTNTDDVLVKQLGQYRTQWDEIEAQIPKLRKVLTETQEIHKRAKDAEKLINRNGLDSSSYEYRGGFDLDSMIFGYMTGKITESAITQTLRDDRREIETYTPSYSPSFGSSSSYGSSSSSSSDSSFSSSSSFGSSSSSDFSTSDSF